MSLVKKLVFRTLLALLLAAAALLVNTVRQASVQERYIPADPTRMVELRPQSLERLSAALTFKTISQDPRMLDTAAFDGLLDLLHREFPLTFEHLEEQVFGSHTLLLKWNGTAQKNRPSAPAINYLFIAHLDVVPVDRQSLSLWSAPPFDGTIAADERGRVLYGRGALDDKSSALALLESLESLLASGTFEPQNNLYFCFGQDEELGGAYGARQVASYFQENGIRFESSLDEGGILSLGSIPGLKQTPVALIGTAEKGYASLEIRFDLPGGHSSMPEAESALTRAAAFVHSLEQEPLFEWEFAPSLQGFIEHLGPEMPLPLRVVFSNLWLFKPVLFSVYQQSNVGRALIQTTVAPTMLSSGVKDNVVPANARVVCNSRILPGHTIEEVVERYQERAEQFGGRVQLYGGSESVEASASASTQHDAFIALGQSIKEEFPDAFISPYLTIGGTDSKHFESVCENSYRFLPLVLTPKEVATIHGTNEAIGEEGYHKMIAFYQRIVQRWAGLSGDPEF